MNTIKVDAEKLASMRAHRSTGATLAEVAERHGLGQGTCLRYLKGTTLRKSDRERFEARVDRNGPVPRHRPELGPCHLWTARRNRAGYGTCDFNGKGELAHRVAFFVVHGRWPAPCALHHCDNRPCVNEAHLFEGTSADNNADRNAKGRNGAARGADNGRAILTEQDVRDIRANYALCRVTQTELARRYGVNPRTVNVIVLRKKWAHV